MDEPKIYGKYSGNLKKELLEKIPTMKEFEIWKLIYYIEDELFWMSHEERNFGVDKIDFIEKQYALEYIIYSTKRFGIDFKEPKEGVHIEKNNSYINWYKKWNNQLFAQCKEYKKLKR